MKADQAREAFERPTVDESLRLIHKLDQCTSDAVKLILLKSFAVIVRNAALDAAAKRAKDEVRWDYEGLSTSEAISLAADNIALAILALKGERS